MKTRDEILSKFAALVEQDAKELDPEFKKRLEPGFGKRKEQEYEGTPEYIPGISGRKDEEPDVSKGYGISKRNAKILAEEDPESYVHKHKYHLVGKLDEITNKMVADIIFNNPGKYFMYGFQNVPKFKEFTKRAAQALLYDNPIILVKTNFFKHPEFFQFVPKLFENTMDLFGISEEEYGNLSSRFKDIKDAALRSGLFELVQFLRVRNHDYFVRKGLDKDPVFSTLSDKDMPFLGEEEYMELPSKRSRYDILGQILQKLAVDIPPVPTNLTVAPPSKLPAGPSMSMPVPMELPEVEPEPTEEEERAFQERQRRQELEEQTYIVEQIPDEVAEALAVLPAAEVGPDRAEGRWQEAAYPYWNYLWSFQVDESRVRAAPTYSADIAKYPATFVGKTSKKPQVIFEQTSPDPVALFKNLRTAIYEQLQKQRGEPGTSRKYEEWIGSDKDVSEENLKKELMKEKIEEREKSLSFLRAKDIITKVSNRLKTKGFVDEAKKLEEVIQNLKY